MKLLQTVVASAVTLAMAGCVLPSNSSITAPGSLSLNVGRSCAQLAQEAIRVSARATAATGIEGRPPVSNPRATGVDLAVHWPIPFAKGSAPNATEMARLREEMVALVETSVQKRCSIQFLR